MFHQLHCISSLLVQNLFFSGDTNKKFHNVYLFCRSWLSDGDDFIPGHVVHHGGSHVDAVFSIQLILSRVAMDNV